MLKNLSFFVCLAFLALLICPTYQSAECEKYVKQLINQIITRNITSPPPLPSIMYSGFNTNNPGQKLQCTTAGYNYFLVYITNATLQLSTYTGICVPNQCKLEDVEMALSYLHCNVYQMQENKTLDAWAITGLVLLGVWILVIVVFSVVSSFRQGDGNQQLLKNLEKSNDKTQVNQRQDNPINNTEVSEMQALKRSQNEQVQQTRKFFNYYEGYTKIFKPSQHKNVIGIIYFLGILSYSITTEFSYRQLISENQKTAPNFLKNFGGIFVCNNQIAVYTILFAMGLKLAYGVYKITEFKEMGRYFFDQVLKKWVYLSLISIFIYGALSCLDQPLGKIWELNIGKQCPSKLWQYWLLARTFILDGGICLPWLWLLETEILLTLISAPFVLIFRGKKGISYGLMVLMMVISILMGILILDNENVAYLPQRLFNNQPEYSVDYNGNTISRAAPFFLGLIFGMLIIEGLEKFEANQNSPEKNLAKKIANSHQLQMALHIVGLIGMLTCFLMILTLIIPDRNLKDDQTGAYVYLLTVPLFFIIFLGLFLLPTFWHGNGKLTHIIKSVLGYSKWLHLDRIGLTFYLVAPLIIGFSVFNMQSSIYYDADTLITYLLGDLTMIYILSLLVTAGIENQISILSSWTQQKIFGEQNRYSVVVVEQA